MATARTWRGIPTATPGRSRRLGPACGERRAGRLVLGQRGRGAGPGRRGPSLDLMVSHDAAAACLPGYPPAPVDPGALAEALRPFGESRMLPPAAYTDPAVFEWERRHFFGSGWTCVALGCQLPSAGSQLAAGTGAGGVLLARGQDGMVRAFANTCRHRGHELLPCGSAGTARAIVCPYHSWAYSLSGELRGAPEFRDLDAAAWSLMPLPAAEWHGLVFLDGSDGAAGPLPLASLHEIVAPYEPSRLVIGATRSYDVFVNGTVPTENY